MKQLKDETKRIIIAAFDSYTINNLIYIELRRAGYIFTEKEIELKYDFIEEGSPSYKTGKIKCLATITKDLTDVQS